MSFWKSIFKHPLTLNLDIDEVETTIRRKQIIQDKPFLRRVYLDWYDEIISKVPRDLPDPILELGSGGGFLKRVIPRIITSDVMCLPESDLVINGMSLPFGNRELGGIIMVNVFHHIRNPEEFINEAIRCLAEKSVIIMIEPWITKWSHLIYSHFHNEPCNINAFSWNFPGEGPLSSANNAQAWIVFNRDRDVFERKFPQLEIIEISPCMPILYLLSGGIALRSLIPAWSYPFWQKIDNWLLRSKSQPAMFAYIVLRRTI